MAADVSAWVFRERDYASEKRGLVRVSATVEHPLAKKKVVKVVAAAPKAFFDPLLDDREDEDVAPKQQDPLSVVVEEVTVQRQVEEQGSAQKQMRRNKAMLSHSSSPATQRATLELLKEIEESSGSSSNNKTFSRSRGIDDDLTERATARLQSLEQQEDGVGGETELVEKLSRAHRQLLKHWELEERVAALKTAISVAKVLKEAKHSFYPSLFVVAAEILDSFGSLVYARIRRKPEREAQETARNWFYKTACVRELIPRFYVEACLVPCYSFLTDETPLPRLASITRGIGSPLVAAYARAYLARFASGRTGLLMARDTLFCFSKIDSVSVLDPAMEAVLGSLDSGDADAFNQVLAQYRDYCNDATVLKRILCAFSPSLVAEKATAVVALAKRAQPSTTSTVRLLGTLGTIFATSPPPKHQRLPILNEVWKVVTRCNDLKDYVSCASDWLDCLLRHYSDREVSVMLEDVAKHTSNASPPPEELEDLVQMLVSSNFLASDHLLKLLDVFRPHRKVEIAKEFLLLQQSDAKKKSFQDPVVIHAILEIGRVAHDSLDSLSPDGERRHVSRLVVAFLDKIDMGRDLERQLGIYVECRAAFHNLDAVLDRLVVKAATLSVASRTLRAKAKKNAKLAERAQHFSKACLAFAHVTIPSIESLFRRLDLLSLSGHAALLNNCLPHADTFFKSAIALIPDLPQKDDGDTKQGPSLLKSFVERLSGSLVVVPGRPDHGPFYLVQGLLNALPRYPHWDALPTAKISAYVALIPLLGAYAQRKLPYSVVEANDVLYGGSPDYLDENKTHLASIVSVIVEDLAKLDESIARTELVLDLVNAIAQVVKLNGDAALFASKLYNLANKNIHTAPPILQRYAKHTQTNLKRFAELDLE